MAKRDTPDVAPAFVDAGWLEWDIDDAYLVITDALDYLDEHDSI